MRTLAAFFLALLVAFAAGADCPWPEDCGGGGNAIPGLVGGVLTDTSRRHLLDHIEDYPVSIPARKVYFANTAVADTFPLGNDTTGRGTPEAPYLTLGKCNEVIAQGGVCMLAGGRTNEWDDNAAHGGGLASAVGGNANTIFDYNNDFPRGAFAGGVGVWGDEPVYIDCSGILDPLVNSGNIQTGAVYIKDQEGKDWLLGGGPGIVFENCPPSEAVPQDGIYYSGNTLSSQNNISGTPTTTTFTDTTLIGRTDVLVGDFVNFFSGAGGAGPEFTGDNIHNVITAFDSGTGAVTLKNALDTAPDGTSDYNITPGTSSRLFALNVSWPDIQGGNNQSYTSHRTNAEIHLIGGSCSYAQNPASTGSQQCYSMVAGTNVLVAQGVEAVDDADTTAASVVAVFANFFDGPSSDPTLRSEQAILDSTIRSTTADDSLRHNAIGYNTSKFAHSFTYLDNVLIEGFDQTDTYTGGLLGNLGSGSGGPGQVDVEIYRTSFSGNKSNVMFVQLVDTGDPLLTVRDRCNVHVGSTDKVYRLGGTVGSCDKMEVDIAYSPWDDDSATNSFRIENQNYTTAALAKTGSDTLGCTSKGDGFDNFFNDSALESSAATEYSDFVDAGICDPTGGDCAQVCPLSEVRPYQLPTTYPTWLFGAEVTAFGPDSGTANAGKNY